CTRGSGYAWFVYW
nr:immunoglobulin heavy chain junction region [Mus musculus]